MTFPSAKFNQLYYAKVTLVLPAIPTFHQKHPFQDITEEDMLLQFLLDTLVLEMWSLV